MKRYRIAVIPGDGIGKEVVPEGIRVLERAGGRYGITFDWHMFPWSCETYLRTGRMMPEDGLEQLTMCDAIFLGAVGFPGVPDPISLWGLLIPIRREMAQYINLRPVHMLKGMVSPLRDRGPEDIDFVVVRENNEGEYPVPAVISHVLRGRNSLRYPDDKPGRSPRLLLSIKAAQVTEKD